MHVWEAVAKTFAGRGQAALIDGNVGRVNAPGGRPFVAFDFVTESGRVVEISLIADRARIASLDVQVL